MRTLLLAHQRFLLTPVAVFTRLCALYVYVTHYYAAAAGARVPYIYVSEQLSSSNSSSSSRLRMYVCKYVRSSGDNTRSLVAEGSRAKKLARARTYCACNMYIHTSRRRAMPLARCYNTERFDALFRGVGVREGFAHAGTPVL